jgi:hypothetical protein
LIYIVLDWLPEERSLLKMKHLFLPLGTGFEEEFPESFGKINTVSHLYDLFKTI